MLYIVGTSIGNIQDTSLRAVQTLCTADTILSEDTRTFGGYYKRIQELYNLQPTKQQTILSFHEQNEFERLPEVLQVLESGQDVALVSESGMPVVSDPGAQLVQQAIKRGIPHTVIPGPTAFTTALAHIGNIAPVYFMGFLPKKDSLLRKTLSAPLLLTVRPLTLVAYESPHRLQKTLMVLDELCPSAHVSVCRELTKKFEEITQGTPSELKSRTFKGEITLVVQLS